MEWRRVPALTEDILRTFGIKCFGIRAILLELLLFSEAPKDLGDLWTINKIIMNEWI